MTIALLQLTKTERELIRSKVHGKSQHAHVDLVFDREGILVDVVDRVDGYTVSALLQAVRKVEFEEQLAQRRSF